MRSLGNHRSPSRRILEKSTPGTQAGRFSVPAPRPVVAMTSAARFFGVAPACYASAMPGPRDVTYFARVVHRNDSRVFGIRQNDRFHHMYIIGKTGTGKSSVLETMAVQ